jgi:putative hydrolase of the HAD superfamily
VTIKAIIFDYGQVLNASEDPEEAAARRATLAAQLDLDPSELWPYLFEGKAARQWMTGRLKWDEFWAAVLEPKGITDPEEIEAFAGAVFADADELHPDMITLLGELKGRYKLALLSNATWSEMEMQEMLYDQLGLADDSFDAVITSTSLGTTKPDPAIYRHTLARLDVLPEETLFVDDLASFTAVAADLGMRAHTFTTPAAFRTYLEELGVL